MDRLPEHEYEVGETVLIDLSRVDAWKRHGLGPKAVITGYRSPGTGAGSVDGGGNASYAIRLEGFDYGASPDNCHTVSSNIILGLDPISEVEVQEAIRSILGAS